MKFIWILILAVATMQAVDLNKYSSEIEKLSDLEKQIILRKGTERPFSGELNLQKGDGVYLCKLCKTPLFRSSDKFDSRSGWPSFDDAIDGAVARVADADGRRVEIVCATCGAHLGHVFEGEGFTDKNTRHCVNSLSLEFENSKADDANLQKAYFAGGCFWGVEHLMQQADGVIEAVSGYMGGHTKNPTYEDVCYRDTGHLEVVEVTYDRAKTSYEALVKLFFEIHDPTQANGQGPDIGSQYLSAVFTKNDEEKRIVGSLIEKLEQKGYSIATKILDFSEFYKAEEYHQDYYKNKGSKPYCHSYTKRFD